MNEQTRMIARVESKYAGVGGDGPAGVVAVAVDASLHDVGERLVVHGIITQERVDVDGDLLLIGGADTSYFPTSVRAVYLDHVYARDSGVAAIGTCRTFTIKDGSIVTDTVLGTTRLAREVETAVREGTIGHFSIGYRNIKSRQPNEHELSVHGPGLKRVVTDWLLLEYSLLSMPANPHARITHSGDPVDSPTRIYIDRGVTVVV